MFSLVNFWWLLTMAALLWFSTVTVYVAYRGASDIKQMLARLAALKEEQGGESHEE